MPELPEVETIRRGLSKYVLHKTIKRIIVLTDKSFFCSNDLNLKNVIRCDTNRTALAGEPVGSGRNIRFSNLNLDNQF